jgi:hypothetical protein
MHAFVAIVVSDLSAHWRQFGIDRADFVSALLATQSDSTAKSKPWNAGKRSTGTSASRPTGR